MVGYLCEFPARITLSWVRLRGHLTLSLVCTTQVSPTAGNGVCIVWAADFRMLVMRQVVIVAALTMLDDSMPRNYELLALLSSAC